MHRKQVFRIIIAILAIMGLTLILGSSAGAAEHKTLHKFHRGVGGSVPYGGLTFDAAGNLYGTAYFGGAYRYGTVFELTPNGDGSWTESVLHSFNKNCKDGCHPSGAVTFDATGNLYGTTVGGESHNQGTVFKLTSNTDGRWRETVLHSFSYKDGAAP